MMEVRQIKKLIDRLKVLKGERSNWNNTWQTVAMYVDTKKADFNTTQTDGQFLNTKVFDNTASQYAKSRASTLKSMVFGNYDFKLTPSYKYKDNSILINFFEEATNILKNEMKNPKANFDKTIEEAEDFDAVFGTSIVYCEFAKDLIQVSPSNETEGIPAKIINNSHLVYKTLNLKECYIDEDFTGHINQLYREFSLTTRQAVEQFGFGNVHERVQKDFNNCDYNNKITILHAIIPINDYENLFDIKNDFEYINIFIDITNEHLLSFSGYRQQPFFVHRENKKVGEKYGRSVSMEAISLIALMNKIQQDILTMANRQAEPPLGITDDKAIVDTSAGSISVFSPTTQNPVFNLINEYGNIANLMQYRETLKEELSKFYGIDKLLDFNNKVQMTAEETRQRAIIRNQAMNYLFACKTNERYSPLIERSFNLLLEHGYFNDLLQDNEELVELIKSGEDLYSIEYYNQIEREKNNIDNQLILNIWNTTGTIAQLTQDMTVFDNLNADKTISLLKNVSYTNSIFRGEEEIQQIREMRQQQQQALLQQQLQQQGNLENAEQQ